MTSSASCSSAVGSRSSGLKNTVTRRELPSQIRRDDRFDSSVSDYLTICLAIIFFQNPLFAVLLPDEFSAATPAVAPADQPA